MWSMCLLCSRNGGVAQMVERMLSMHEAQGSIPCFSTFFVFVCTIKKICLDRGSNTGPLDLQSNALPTELSKHVMVVRDIRTGGIV